jgi:hypothetical protein
MSISDSWMLRVQKLPRGRMMAMRPSALASDWRTLLPLPVICTRAFSVPVVPDSATPNPASSVPMGVGDRRMS